MPLFADRRAAGHALALAVQAAVPETSLVLALPRGGVPVGSEVAAALRTPLDIVVVRKLGMPGEEELALGAIASGGVRVLNRELIEYLQVSPEQIEELTTREVAELQRREQLYREGRPLVPVENQTLVLVDDGLATGATMLAAARSLRPRGVRRIIVAVPVAAKSICEEFRKDVDQIICLATPNPFDSVGKWYEDFAPTSDEEVRQLLKGSARNLHAEAGHSILR